MIRTKTLTLSNSPQVLTFDDAIDKQKTISVQNTHASGIAYIGNENVSSSSYGLKLLPGQGFSADLSPYDNIYASGTGTAAVMVVD